MEPSNYAEVLAQFFPSVAVQLRSALGNIYLAAAALAPAEAREKDPELDRKAAALDQSYYQLLRLVNNLTALSHVGGGLLPARDQDIVKIIRDVCDRSRFLAELLGLRLTFSCQEASHLCAVYQDSIEQLLFQLLSNAFKFTPDGGSISVELKISGGQVILSVADTGCGIPEERIPTLFDRYLHREIMDPLPHGLGLGLPLCRQIAEGHGGSIMAESREGRGTKIILSIPNRQTGVSGVSDVPFDYAGGFNRTLLALSDALPAAAFRIENQD